MNMAAYIATFFSHFGAIRFHKMLKTQGIEGILMPVPRKVSSSCGTCVSFESDNVLNIPEEDLESLFQRTECGYDCVICKV